MTLGQHRSHTASLDCVVKTVSKILGFNLLAHFNIWTLGKSNAKITIEVNIFILFVIDASRLKTERLSFIHRVDRCLY